MKAFTAIAFAPALAFPDLAGHRFHEVLDDMRAAHGLPGAALARAGAGGTVHPARQIRAFGCVSCGKAYKARA